VREKWVSRRNLGAGGVKEYEGLRERGVENLRILRDRKGERQRDLKKEGGYSCFLRGLQLQRRLYVWG